MNSLKIRLFMGQLLQRTLLGSALLLTLLNTSHADMSAMNTTNERLMLDKKGIKVWTYQTPNNPVMNYRATTIVDGSMANLLSLILDTNHLVDWVPYVKAVDVIERNDQQGNFIIRMEMNFPFPLQNRDVVVKGKISQDSDGTIFIKNQAANDARVPVQAKIVRITQYQGDWQLKPLPNGKISVTNLGYADPAGHIPLAVANMFTQQLPYEMMAKLQGEHNRGRYKHTTICTVNLAK